MGRDVCKCASLLLKEIRGLQAFWVLTGGQEAVIGVCAHEGKGNDCFFASSHLDRRYPDMDGLDFGPEMHLPSGGSPHHITCLVRLPGYSSLGPDFSLLWCGHLHHETLFKSNMVLCCEILEDQVWTYSAVLRPREHTQTDCMSCLWEDSEI